MKLRRFAFFATCIAALSSLALACGTTNADDDVVVADEGSELNAFDIDVVGSIAPGESKTVTSARRGAPYPALSFALDAGDTVSLNVRGTMHPYSSADIYLLAPNKKRLTMGMPNSYVVSGATATAYKPGTYYVAVRGRGAASDFEVQYESRKAGPPPAPDPCNACGGSGCMGCASQKGCGWDPVNEVCLSGNVNGSKTGFGGGGWAWGIDSCKGEIGDRVLADFETCQAAGTDCTSCAATPGCGWKHHVAYLPHSSTRAPELDSDLCLPGYEGGPTSTADVVAAHRSDFAMNSVEDSWMYEPTECPVAGRKKPPVTCNGFFYGNDRSTDFGYARDDGGTPPPQKEPYLDWTCDVTRVVDGVTVHDTENLCAFASEVDREAEYYSCTLSPSRGRTSCSVGGCVSHGCCWNGCDR